MDIWTCSGGLRISRIFDEMNKVVGCHGSMLDVSERCLMFIEYKYSHEVLQNKMLTHK